MLTFNEVQGCHVFVDKGQSERVTKYVLLSVHSSTGDIHQILTGYTSTVSAVTLTLKLIVLYAGHNDLSNFLYFSGYVRL